jgi:Hemerythrin HHE cation binding domain
VTDAMAGGIPEPLAGLIRDHRRIEHTLAEATQAITAAVSAPTNAALIEAALSRAHALQRLLEWEVAIHIEKEEEVLFPVVRKQIDGTQDLVDDMIAEHEDVRTKRELLRRALASLDSDHNVIERAKQQLTDGIRGAGMSGTTVDPIGLATLRELVVHLDWLLQGHFTGEEDGVFLPAEELLSPETLAGMVQRMFAIDARWQTEAASG